MDERIDGECVFFASSRDFIVTSVLRYRRAMPNNDLTEAGPPTPANDTLESIGFFDSGCTDDDDLEVHDPPPPSAYLLCTNEGRCGFLEAYIWRGEAALWESVNHIWSQLRPPKDVRCTNMAIAAGTGGIGKKALVPLLRRALREALDNDLVQPHIKDYPDIDAFHQASMAYFADDYGLYEKAVQKYADIINGGPEQPAPEGVVIEGPWVTSPAET
jgi:hypothetical protein